MMATPDRTASMKVPSCVLQMQAEREAALLERDAAKQQAAHLQVAIECVFLLGFLGLAASSTLQ